MLTGASSGIGHAAALAFTRCGADLVLAARGRSGLDAVAAECRRLGAQALVVPTDVADGPAMQALAEAAIDHFGGFDVWVNNVGVGVVGLFHQVPIEAHRRVVEANLIGHMNGAHAALTHFWGRRRGTLIIIVSVAGLASAPYSAAYVATKFGLRGFAESLRAEVSGLRGVHVCDLYPTFVDTPAMAHAANYTGRKIAPPPPVLDPRAVAAAVVSLADRPRASMTVGSIALPARIAHAVAPRLVGRVLKALIGMSLARADAAPVTEGNLYTPSVGTGIDGWHRNAGLRMVAGAAAVTLALGWLARRMSR